MIGVRLDGSCPKGWEPCSNQLNCAPESPDLRIGPRKRAWILLTNSGKNAGPAGQYASIGQRSHGMREQVEAEYSTIGRLVHVVAERRSGMKNIGPVSRKWLAEVGIYTVEELRTAGSIPTYLMLKEMYPESVSLNLLWGLEAAIRDIDWRDLTETDKDELKKKLR